MPRGYMEGPASEEREAELERLERPQAPPARERLAVYGATEDDPPLIQSLRATSRDSDRTWIR